MSVSKLTVLLPPVDYSLNNPDVLSKYKDAAEIAHRVLEAVVKMAVEGATVLSLCQEGDKLLEEETQKVYKGKKISKGTTFIVVFPFHLLLIDCIGFWWFTGICSSHSRSWSLFITAEILTKARFDRNCFPHHCFPQ